MTATAASHHRRTALLAGAAALVAIGGAVAVARSGPPASSSTALRLQLSEGTVAASCAGFSKELLRDMSPAFAGTVSVVDDSQVVLQVDRW